LKGRDRLRDSKRLQNYTLDDFVLRRRRRMRKWLGGAYLLRDWRLNLLQQEILWTRDEVLDPSLAKLPPSFAAKTPTCLDPGWLGPRRRVLLLLRRVVKGRAYFEEGIDQED
jgi:hypothetical protein